MSDPVVVLNENLEPQGFLIPCPATVSRCLGIEPHDAVLHCAELAGHEGWHRFTVHWGDDA